MSSSPKDLQDDAAERDTVDELDEHHPEPEAEGGTAEVVAENPQPVKRGRGRPKGSRNKKPAASSSATSSSVPAIPRKRGRPPKAKSEQEGGPAPKRPRGRPPKNPRPPLAEPGEGDGTTAEATIEAKKRPGRPKKTAS